MFVAFSDADPITQTWGSARQTSLYPRLYKSVALGDKTIAGPQNAGNSKQQ